MLCGLFPATPTVLHNTNFGIALELLERLIEILSQNPQTSQAHIHYHIRNRHPSPDHQQEFLLCIRQHRGPASFTIDRSSSSERLPSAMPAMPDTTKYRVSHEVHPFVFFSHLLENIDNDFWESESEVASTSTSSDETDAEAEDHTSSNEGSTTSPSGRKTPSKSNRDEKDKGRNRCATEKDCTSTKRAIHPEMHSDKGLSEFQRKAKRTKKSPANAAA